MVDRPQGSRAEIFETPAEVEKAAAAGQRKPISTTLSSTAFNREFNSIHRRKYEPQCS